MEIECIKYSSHLDLCTSHLIELIKEGVIVASRTLQPIYLNRKAQETCQQLCDRSNVKNLSSFIAYLYHKSLAEFSYERREVIINYQIDDECVIRIRVNYVGDEVDNQIELDRSETNERDDCPWLLFFIEDRTAILQEELRIEQKKYGLSDREAEISHLLLQSYSYQDIARQLQISLNTVKFHVKNINGKKRSCLTLERYCFTI